MPFMVRCKYCNHYYFTTVYKDAEAFIIDHICDKHPNLDVEFKVLRISRELYGDYLRCKDNPHFWFALRHIRKPHKIPLFV